MTREALGSKPAQGTVAAADADAHALSSSDASLVLFTILRASDSNFDEPKQNHQLAQELGSVFSALSSAEESSVR